MQTLDAHQRRWSTQLIHVTTIELPALCDVYCGGSSCEGSAFSIDFDLAADPGFFFGGMTGALIGLSGDKTARVAVMFIRLQVMRKLK